MTAELTAAVQVAATVLGEVPFRFETVLEDWDCETPQFLSPHQIVLEAPVKLEAEDRLWLGSVLTCRAEGEQWRTTLRVEHTLKNLASLLRLAARFE